MIINTNNGKTVSWYNNTLDKQEAQRYINENTYWVENAEIPEPQEIEGMQAVLCFDTKSKRFYYEYIEQEEQGQNMVSAAAYNRVLSAGAEMALCAEVLPATAGIFTECFERWQPDGEIQKKGDVLQYQGMTYQCINDIQRFENFSPDIATNNYNPYPKPDENGIFHYVYGMGVSVGMLVRENDKIYKAVQNMTKQINPPSALPAIFQEVVI